MLIDKKKLLKPIFIFFFAVSLLIIVYPFFPQLIYWMKYDLFDFDWHENKGYEISVSDEGEASIGQPTQKQNTLYIPVIGVEVPIVEGDGDEALNKGAWHRPDTGDPENGGNMVITGHRFQYLPPNNLTFYHLDKVKEGDEIIVSWNEIEYDYVVVETFVVEPESVEIEDQTANNVLTLYTCTPLWTADMRLVVRAEPKINQ